MKPNEVPDVLCEAAYKAHHAQRFLACGEEIPYEKAVRGMLAAVLPLHEQQIREQIADEAYDEEAAEGMATAGPFDDDIKDYDHDD